jgi:hypothetical protein
VFEFFYGSKHQSTVLGTSWWTEIKEELSFAFQFQLSTKVWNKHVKLKPLTHT